MRSSSVPGGYATTMKSDSKELYYTEVGTRRRYRRMSRNFSPKTRPGSLQPQRARGKAQGWYRIPVPGLVPRDNLGTLADMRRPIFTKNVQDKINASAKLLFTD